MATPAPPEVSIQLNLDSVIRVAGQSQPMSMRGLGRPLLFLVLLQGASVKRAAMARVLWPAEPEDVAANRLRVSLSRIKAMFGAALVADRTRARLAGVTVHFDLQERLTQLQEALDEVDPQHQLPRLKGFADDLQYVGWREFQSLDSSGLIGDWEHACRLAIAQLMNLAVRIKDWETVDTVWGWMRHRGDLDPKVCERLLDAYSEQENLDQGLRLIRTAAGESGFPESGPLFQSLKKYAQSLKEAQQKHVTFQSSHCHLLGSALLGQIERHADSMGALMVLPEVQIHMQSLPGVYVQILDATVAHLEPGSPTWIEVQAARLSAYASLYDDERVFEICRLLFLHEMPPVRASSTWMHYSFGLFQIRRWDEAISSIQQAQNLARQAGEDGRAAICHLTEAAYYWHLGRIEEARRIYDDYLTTHADSQDFTVGINAVICRANYAVIEMVFGDLQQARQHVDLAYGERNRFNISRLLPNLLSLMSVVYARQGEVHQGAEYAVEGLKLTFARNSSREGQLNMEWACGVLAAGGLRAEAWQVMRWVNDWRKRTKHTRSLCEQRYAESLGLQEFEGSKPIFSDQDEYRDVMRYLIRGLRHVQRTAPKLVAAAAKPEALI